MTKIDFTLFNNNSTLSLLKNNDGFVKLIAESTVEKTMEHVQSLGTYTDAQIEYIKNYVNNKINQN